MRLVTRYILREHIGPLVFSVTALTSLLLLNYISKKFGELVGKGLPWGVIAKFFALSVPFTVAMTLPMAVLISTLYAFSRMAADSEISALMSCGVSTRQLMTPVLLVGLVLSLTMVGFNDQILPRSNFELAALMSSIQQKKPTLALKPQVLNEVSEGSLYMWLSQLDTRTNSMRDVTIYDLGDPMVRHTIVADSGTLAFAQNKSDLLLTLYSGYVQETRNTLPDRYERTFFNVNILKVANVANQLQLDREGGYKSDREKTICELQEAVKSAQRQRDSALRALAALDSNEARKRPARYGSRTGEWYCRAMRSLFTVKTAEAQSTSTQAQIPRPVPDSPLTPQQLVVKAAARNVEFAERAIANNEVEIQKKLALSFACLVFALVGPPIALRFPRSGIGLTIGVSLAVFSLYYVGLIAGETLGNNLKASPAVTMWAANAIMSVIGVILISRMSRGGANARGGGFAAFLDRILWFRRRA